MRFAKLFVVSCTAVLFFGGLFHEPAAADGNARHARLVADGTQPLPNPKLVADGTQPLPNPELVADGTQPLPNPKLVV